MTMNVTYSGASNGGSDKRALFLKLFTGEVYEAFRNSTIARDLVQRRSLTGGKEAQFIHTGAMTAGSTM